MVGLDKDSEGWNWRSCPTWVLGHACGGAEKPNCNDWHSDRVTCLQQSKPATQICEKQEVFFKEAFKEASLTGADSVSHKE